MLSYAFGRASRTRSMAPQYMPLDALQDEGTNSQMPTTSIPKRRSYGITRRWPFAFVGLLIVVLLYTVFNRRGFRPTIPTSPSIAEPLLGPEDATKLWFPFVGDTFQPTVAPYNVLQTSSQRVRTPLLIGFTRNSAMLQQAVLSFIAAGWPREDIIVVDNSGTMTANSDNLLTSENPFQLSYPLFRTRYGISIVQTPTLLSFSQLQNFFLRMALAHNWTFYFWSHMDIAILPDESEDLYTGFYPKIQSLITTDLLIPDLHSPSATAEKWALKYFAYDWLTLIHVDAWHTIGAWDPFIPYYASDCDAYSRIALHGFSKADVHVGERIFDLAGTIPDPEHKFFPTGASVTDEDMQPNSARYRALLSELSALQAEKKEGARNHWQESADGNAGKGEPWTYNPKGFQKMWWETANVGRNLYAKKWGTSECRLDEVGLSLEDEGMGDWG